MAIQPRPRLWQLLEDLPSRVQGEKRPGLRQLPDQEHHQDGRNHPDAEQEAGRLRVFRGTDSGAGSAADRHSGCGRR